MFYVVKRSTGEIMSIHLTRADALRTKLRLSARYWVEPAHIEA